jgi:hypothetical protein
MKYCGCLFMRIVALDSEVTFSSHFSVNSTNVLPCFDFFGCDCGHLGRSVGSGLIASGQFRILSHYVLVPSRTRFCYFQGEQSHLLLESHRFNYSSSCRCFLVLPLLIRGPVDRKQYSSHQPTCDC